MEQSIRFCRSSDGVRIAYAMSGSGPPLVKAANYLTHLEHDWNGPVWQPWLRELSRDHTLIRYDERGSGLSDRDVSEFSIEAWVRDLEAVIDAAGLDRFPIFGMSQGVAVAIAYAARHPDRVSHLVLYGGYARGRFQRGVSDEERLEAETLINTIRVGWGRENPAFRQLFTTLLMPDASDDQRECLNQIARISASPEAAAAMERAFYEIDVVAEASRLETPTLVLHATADACVPFEESRFLASLIQEARLVPLESRNHILLSGEPAWDRFFAEMREFINVPEKTFPSGLRERLPDLTPRETEVLELMARGETNDEIATRLTVSPKTVRNHVANIYDKLGVHGRAQAVIRAINAGLGADGEA